MIAGRKTAGRITGTICVDGHPQSATRFARLVGYVEQADIHMPLATVQEALLFSAALRTPPGPGRARLAATVDHVLRQVELTQLSGMLIGTAGKVAAGRECPAACMHAPAPESTTYDRATTVCNLQAWMA